MTKLKIEYKDFSGDISERFISDFYPETDDAISAFCHLRNDRRTFKLANINKAISVDSGELIENLCKAFGLELNSDAREKLISINSKILPAIKTLKFFALQIRGFSSRERVHLILFIRELTESESYTSDEIGTWLQTLWCSDLYVYQSGQTDEYHKLLNSISSEIKPECKIVALNIAKGSGRKPIEPEILERIDLEFGI